jgi:hypothetical protein
MKMVVQGRVQGRVDEVVKCSFFLLEPLTRQSVCPGLPAESDQSEDEGSDSAQ